MITYRYYLYGLTIESVLALPELGAAPPGTAADVTIVLGPVPLLDPAIAEPQPIDGGHGIAVAGVARFAIRGGTSIVVEAEDGASPGNIRLYLLGSAMGMLLHQAGLMPLHANAVEIDGHAIAVMGPSGSGKSTLAARFHDSGHQVISDDVCVIRFDEAGRAIASPGLPRLRLWRAALEASGRSPDGFAASYSGDPTYDKFDVPIRPGERDMGRRSLAAIYLLTEGSERTIQPISGARAVAALMANSYRGAYAAAAGQSKAQWRDCVAVARAVPLFEFGRPLAFDRLQQDADLLRSHSRALAKLPQPSSDPT